jgi:hypothetical protein
VLDNELTEQAVACAIPLAGGRDPYLGDPTGNGQEEIEAMTNIAVELEAAK